MNLELEAYALIIIKADLAKVWEVLTNPALMKEYLYGANTITDWKPGSEIIFEGVWEGQKYRDKGILQEVVFQKRISYTYWSSFYGFEDKPENYCLITCDLAQVDNSHVSLKWSQKGFENEERQLHYQNGMMNFLERIKAIAER